LPGLANVHHVAGGDGHGLLPVDGHVNLPLVLAGADGNGGAIADDEGAIRQHVRTDGGDAKDAAIRGKDWPAGSERVGGRTGGGRDNEAVGVVFGKGGAIDPRLEADEAGKGAAANDGVVEPDAAGDGRLATPHLHLEQDALGFNVRSGDDALDSLLDG